MSLRLHCSLSGSRHNQNSRCRCKRTKSKIGWPLAKSLLLSYCLLLLLLLLPSNYHWPLFICCGFCLSSPQCEWVYRQRHGREFCCSTTTFTCLHHVTAKQMRNNTVGHTYSTHSVIIICLKGNRNSNYVGNYNNYKETLAAQWSIINAKYRWTSKI